MLRILIVEDEPLLAISLRAQLEQRGFEVLEIAHNGQEAVEANRQQCPDVILMDIRMPIMDGIEATRQIMAERPTCIVVLSALAERDTIARAKEAGARAYLMKPADVEMVVQTLQRAFSAHV